MFRMRGISMKNFKIVLAALAIVIFLALGTSFAAEAKHEQTPPAVVFTQDKDSRMLVKNSFTFDNGIMVDIERDIDHGFYINLPLE